MEILKTRVQIFKKTLTKLEETTDYVQSSNVLHPRETRDALIQRFEYCTDIFWKLLKDFLRVKYGTELEVARPKPTLNECTTIRFLTNDEYKACLQIIDDRNITSYAYDEDIADDVAARIHLMKAIFVRLQRELSVRG